MSEIIFKQGNNKFKLEVPAGSMVFKPIDKRPCGQTTIHLDQPVILESINCT